MPEYGDGEIHRRGHASGGLVEGSAAKLKFPCICFVSIALNKYCDIIDAPRGPRKLNRRAGGESGAGGFSTCAIRRIGIMRKNMRVYIKFAFQFGLYWDPSVAAHLL